MNDKLIIYNANKTIMLRRQYAENKAKENFDKAMNIVGFSTLFATKNILISKIAKVKYEKGDYGNLLVQLKEIESKLSKLLEEYGLKLEDLTPKHYCKLCNDTGFVEGVRCSCYAKLLNTLRERAMNAENTPALLENVTSNIFSEKDREYYSLLRDKMTLLVNTFPNIKTRFLVFSGGTGTGKTYLAKSIAGQFEKMGKTAVVISSFNLINTFNNYYRNFDMEEDSSLMHLIECDLLVIDDLGAEITKGTTEKFLINLLNERNAFGNLTIITTNLSPEQIQVTYGERVASRLSDKVYSRTIPFDFEDLRKKQ